LKTPEIGLIVLRKNGMWLLDKVLKRIETVESLSVRGIFLIKWKDEDRESKLKEFYPHLSLSIVRRLTETHGVEMIAIVLEDSHPDPLNMSCPKCGHRFTGERLSNMHLNRIKDDFRSLYGNVVHSSDTEKTALNEIDALGIKLDKDKKIGICHSDSDLVGRLSKVCE